MSIIATLEPMMVQGLKNGMTFKQIESRMPALVARKLSITEAQFHQQFEAETGPFDQALNSLIQRVVDQFTPAERRKILSRK